MLPRYLYHDLPQHAMRNVSRFCLRAHTLTINPLSGAMQLGIVASALFLWCKMRCMCFFTVETCLCALS